ncbi:Der1-like protein [Lentithecium fluviatile CBS 122367]|uniref:Derlin n=1 Tax=Lentithecium fluviatile CBS 122367 TaxID=1168545 RepID=A0A6G1IFK9_9PLEO|nr:Der1-like protein [Lentithecium fluviatile CBS 122367]
MDVFWTLPPVTRTIAAAAVVVSALGYAGIISLGNFAFFKGAVFTTKMVPQVWRLVTAFFITKPKFGIVLDPYFLYQYGSGLERESSRFSQPGDFFTYTIFCGSIIVTTSDYLPAQPCTSCSGSWNRGRAPLHVAQSRHSHNLKGAVRRVSMVGTPVEKAQRTRNSVLCGHTLTLVKALAGYILQNFTFLPALSLAYAYTYAQDNPTRQVSFFIITFDSKYLPFAMLFMTLIMDGGDDAIAQATGLLAAHMYDFLTRIWPTFGGGTNYIKTPQVVKGWFGAKPGVPETRPYGSMLRGGGGGAAEAAASGRTTGFDARGPGRRLGE